MSYCKISDKTATVTWKFGGDSPQVFTSNVVPINVLVGVEQALGVWTADTYDKITPSYIARYNGSEVESPIAQGRTVRTAVTNRIISTDNNTSAGNVGIRSAFFTPSASGGAYIKIFDILGNLLFENTKQVNQAPSFKVACGSECPEGFCKCIIPEYPGYCCLDCGAVAASIREITNELRGENGR